MTRQFPGRFLVAFSLAGEQRDLVRRVAEEVERRLGQMTVFYDEWFEHYLAGRDADLMLQRIYNEQSDLAVICISGAYGSKPWTRAEHEVVRARYMQAAISDMDRFGVMAVRVGDGDVEGIPLNYIVPDLRLRSISEAAQLIVDRLGLVRPDRLQLHADVVQWPPHAPDFRWPIADHTEAQVAFCELLTQQTRIRLLPIQGATETGKSSLGRQMERNVTDLLPALGCGRFDFRGTADRRIEEDAFVRSLGITAVPDQGSNDRLPAVLSQLLHTAKPTILIFDAYEDSGAARSWIERVFFEQLRRADWLRVVVLGQQVPSGHGTLWEPVVARTVRLRLPEPEDWLKYGRLHRPDDHEIDLDFVTRAHRLSGGKPSTLASLLGPDRGASER